MRAANLVRKLAINRPNRIWMAEITYIRLANEFMYRTVILDAYSRRVSWQLHLRSPSSLPILFALSHLLPLQSLSLVTSINRRIGYVSKDSILGRGGAIKPARVDHVQSKPRSSHGLLDIRLQVSIQVPSVRSFDLSRKRIKVSLLVGRRPIDAKSCPLGELGMNQQNDPSVPVQKRMTKSQIAHDLAWTRAHSRYFGPQLQSIRNSRSGVSRVSKQCRALANSNSRSGLKPVLPGPWVEVTEQDLVRLQDIVVRQRSNG